MPASAPNLRATERIIAGLCALFINPARILRHGDKNVGIQQLEIAADRGHYLRPFAKILVALVALREKTTEVARAQLKELVSVQFDVDEGARRATFFRSVPHRKVRPRQHLRLADPRRRGTVRGHRDFGPIQ